MSFKYLYSILIIVCLLMVACEDKSILEDYETVITEPDIKPSYPINSTTNEGDCANFDLSIYLSADRKLNKQLQLRVLKDQAIVYSSAEALSGHDTLAFSTPLKDMQEIKNGRIKVRKEGEDELGWVSLEDLLCTNRPIVDPNKGLEKKVYIKTEIRERQPGEPAFVIAYPMPKKQCNDKCYKLSRFAMYFIVDQQDEWLLLADKYDVTRPLVGWVRKSDVYLWDTAYGLRPKDNLSIVDKQGKNRDAVQCVYRSLNDAINKHHCMPVLSGKRWYQTNMRMPLLDIVDRYGQHIPPTTIADSKNQGNSSEFYKVALSMPGRGVTQKSKYGVGITAAQFNDSSIEKTFVSMKYIDVFFLIDGTKSMQPFIDMVRGKNGDYGIVQQIANTLRHDPNFKQSKFRFGFRIYRDRYARKKELGDGFALRAGHCNELTHKDTDENLRLFHNKIANIQASVNDRDDYPENLFGGLKQALQDLRSCKKHTKLLFVIGDHGDKHDQEMNDLKEIIAQRKKDNNRWVTFFIQTPNNPHKVVKHPLQYEQAYDKYHNQGNQFLTEIFKGTKTNPKNYFIHLQTETATNQQEIDCTQLNNRTKLNVNLLKKRILCGVKAFSKYGIIDEIVVDMRGGAALEEVIEKLQNKNTDIPGLFWEFIKQEGCAILGKQCKHRVYDTSFEGYIPVTNDISLDVWMNSNQLLNWKQDILYIFDKGFKQFTSTQQREELQKAIAENLKLRLRKPEMDANKTYAEYFQRHFGLPVRVRSPLLSYNPTQFQDSSQIPNCELDRLAVWATNVGEILGIVYEGKFRPDYKSVPPPENTCVKASENGKKIPFIDGRIGKVPLGNDDTYRYDHEIRGSTIYWVPEEFLP